MNQNELKQQAARAAIEFVEEDTVVGVGTGSTVNFFIDELAKIKNKIEGAVATSVETEKRLKASGIAVVDLNSVRVPVYIDGADEFNDHLQLIKGGGGALTREKIVATAADKFVCIVDESKKVNLLGKDFPVPVEVIPMARSLVARAIVKLGGEPVYREHFVTDNGNVILDVYNLNLVNPVETEQQLNNLTGVVSNGIFAQRTADVVLIAKETGVEQVVA